MIYHLVRQKTTETQRPLYDIFTITLESRMMDSLRQIQVWIPILFDLHLVSREWVLDDIEMTLPS